jgi:hypothetical protein
LDLKWSLIRPRPPGPFGDLPGGDALTIRGLGKAFLVGLQYALPDAFLIG